MAASGGRRGGRKKKTAGGIAADSKETMKVGFLCSAGLLKNRSDVDQTTIKTLPDTNDGRADKLCI